MDAVLTVGDVAAKVLSDDDVPGWAVSTVELLLDLGSDVLFDVVLFECCGGDVYALLLHLLAHVDVFDDGFWAVGAVLYDGGGVGGGRRVELVGHGGGGGGRGLCGWWW